MLTREIPAVTKNLLIINSIMFIATLGDGKHGDRPDRHAGTALFSDS